ncbi:Methionine aminopeptidase, partial [hydrothermal vent metagenome]
MNVDITLSKNGFIADSSKMYVLEAAGIEAKRLVNTT